MSLAMAMARRFRLEPRNVVIRETNDPEVVVGESDDHATLKSDGRSFVVANVIVVRARNGQIVASRDYRNHAVITDFIGTV